jgi:hypothetical protein
LELALLEEAAKLLGIKKELSQEEVLLFLVDLAKDRRNG